MALCKCYIRTWRLSGGWNGACEHRKVRPRTSSEGTLGICRQYRRKLQFIFLQKPF